jgi:hypothetical protein
VIDHRICQTASKIAAYLIQLESKMTSYRALLLAGAVVLSATSAYASGGKAGIANRDDGLINRSAPQSSVFDRRASEGVLLEGRSSVVGPAPSGYEEGSTWSRVPATVRDEDIATRGNGNK